VKLSAELSRRPTGQTLYVLDEPTTGLHFDDVRKLLEVLSRLVDHGNTVIVIEHNLDVIKTADWIVDLGPEGGERGGDVVAEGTPEEVAATSGSYTGEVLIPVLGPVSRRKTAGRPKARRSKVADRPKAPAAPTKAAAKGRPKKASVSVPAASTRARKTTTTVNGSTPRAKVPAKAVKATKVSAATKTTRRAKVPAARSGRR
jgi:excinuclease ABC subunit A